MSIIQNVSTYKHTCDFISFFASPGVKLEKVILRSFRFSTTIYKVKEKVEKANCFFKMRVKIRFICSCTVVGSVAKMKF